MSQCKMGCPEKAVPGKDWRDGLCATCLAAIPEVEAVFLRAQVASLTKERDALTERNKAVLGTHDGIVGALWDYAQELGLPMTSSRGPLSFIIEQHKAERDRLKAELAALKPATERFDAEAHGAPLNDFCECERGESGLRVSECLRCRTEIIRAAYAQGWKDAPALDERNGKAGWERAKRAEARVRELEEALRQIADGPTWGCEFRHEEHETTCREFLAGKPIEWCSPCVAAAALSPAAPSEPVEAAKAEPPKEQAKCEACGGAGYTSTTSGGGAGRYVGTPTSREGAREAADEGAEQVSGKFDAKGAGLDLTKNVSTWLDWGLDGIRALHAEMTDALTKAEQAGFKRGVEESRMLIGRDYRCPVIHMGYEDGASCITVMKHAESQPERYAAHYRARLLRGDDLCRECKLIHEIRKLGEK